jgi:hypothetical protein
MNSRDAMVTKVHDLVEKEKLTEDEVIEGAIGISAAESAHKRVRDMQGRPMRKFWPEYITLILFGCLLAFAIPFHEPWADEAQAWMLARSLTVWQLFHTYLRYEGSPGLWHLLLWLLVRLHVSYTGMHWVCGLIAFGGISVLVLCSPFPRWIKLVLPFTYFLAFQYAVVARNYVLVPLLLFSIAALWKRSPILVAFLLGLLANIAGHAAAIAIGFSLLYWIKRRLSVTRSQLWKAAVVFCVMLAIAVWTVLPPNDGIKAAIGNRK